MRYGRLKTIAEDVAMEKREVPMPTKRKKPTGIDAGRRGRRSAGHRA